MTYGCHYGSAFQVACQALPVKQLSGALTEDDDCWCHNSAVALLSAILLPRSLSCQSLHVKPTCSQQPAVLLLRLPKSRLCLLLRLLLCVLQARELLLWGVNAVAGL